MLEPLNNSLVHWGEGTHNYTCSVQDVTCRNLLPWVARRATTPGCPQEGTCKHAACWTFWALFKLRPVLELSETLSSAASSQTTGFLVANTPLSSTQTTGRRLPRLAAYSQVAFVGGRFFACSQRANKWQPQANLAGWRTWQHTSHASWIKKGLANESIIG